MDHFRHTAPLGKLRILVRACHNLAHTLIMAGPMAKQILQTLYSIVRGPNTVRCITDVRQSLKGLFPCLPVPRFLMSSRLML